MTTTRKGIHKGLRFISHLFVAKEHEMEIGNPTDVKHVAHIGLDGSDGNAPTWMNEFRTGSIAGRSSTGDSVGGSSCGGGSRDPTWTSQDFDQSMISRQQSSSIYTNFPPTNIPSIPKKQPKRIRKGKSSSSASSSSSSSVSKSTSSTPKSNSSRSSRRKSTRGAERDESDIDS